MAPKRKRNTTPKKLRVSRRRLRRQGSSRKVGLKRKRAAKARLHKTVKSTVQKVLECKENVGVYTVMHTGEIEPFVNAGQDKIAFGSTRNQANAGIYTAFDMGFVPFSRKKILNALSVLWNGKAKALNWSLNDDNFQIKGLKCDALYCSYEFKLLNYTEIPYTVEFWECVNKESSDQHPLDQLKDMLASDEWISPAPTYATASGTQYDIDKTLEFSMIKAAKNKFKFTRVKSGVIYPGLGMSYFTKQGHTCYDMTKVTVNVADVGVLPSHAKGDKHLFVRYSPLLHLQASTTNHVATNKAISTSVERGFLVEVKEVFKFLEPPETDDIHVGDKRASLIDIPAAADGVGPFIDRFVNTGPAYTTLTNPSV